MSWSRTGTVSVTLNSNAVTGVGTGFLTSSRNGDGFVGPDGALYEVINIASDTAMSISPNYNGATASGAAYALIPVQGYPKALADSFNALNSNFGGLLGGMTAGGTDGLTEGTNNKYFTQARVLATPLTGLVLTSAALAVAADTALVGIGKLQAQLAAAAVTVASAATVDIGAANSGVVAISGTVAITGLGTAAAGVRRTVRFLGSLVLTYNATSLILPTGASITTAADDTAEMLSLGGGNWFCLRYTLANGKTLAFSFDRSNVVGSVSQTSGIPTGALIENGSNASGEYWKFASGLMLCKGAVSSSALANSTLQVAYTIPASFASTDYFAAAFVQPLSTVDFYGCTFKVNSSATQVQFGYRNGATAQNITGHWIAIGRWY